MKTIVQQLIEDETFIAEMKEAIQAKIFGMHGTVYDSSDGLQPATATEFEFESDLKFSGAEADDMACNLDFSTTGTATLAYKGSEGDDRTSECDGDCTGTIEITFPSFTLTADSIDDLVSSVETDITIDSAPLKEQEPVDESNFPEDA